jgi:ribosome-binding factor A
MSTRTEQIGGLIAQKISDILQRDISDPRLSGLVTITGAKVSADLRNAVVYWSVLGNEEVWKEVDSAFLHAAGYIQRLVGQRISLKITPILSFAPDHTMEQAQKIEILIDHLKPISEQAPEEK